MIIYLKPELNRLWYVVQIIGSMVIFVQKSLAVATWIPIDQFVLVILLDIPISKTVVINSGLDCVYIL